MTKNDEIPKGKVLSVGQIIDGNPVGWEFNGLGKVALISVSEDGTVRYCGYSVHDLEKIKLGGTDDGREG